jgi:hypothetical protein
LKSIQSAIEELRVEQPIATFRQRVHAVLDSFGDNPSKAFETESFPLLESWIASEFGTLTGATHAQLAPLFTPNYDFSIRRSGTLHHFDATEAKDPKRDRLEEYRESEWLGFPMKETGSRQIRAQIEQAIPRIDLRLKRKARAKGTRRLVLYVNTGWLPKDDVLEANFRRWHKKYVDRFEEAFLLLRGAAVQIVPHIVEFGAWRR